MAEFYKELKLIREEKGIELAKIHKRTKISLSALQAIEKGKFDQLPYTYVRLFLRAYAVEIGANPEEALESFEIFIGNKEEVPNKKIDESFDISAEALFSNDKTGDIKKKSEQKNSILRKRPSISIRTDITKSIFIVSTLVFAVYIILSINKEVEANKPKEFISDFEEEGPISDQMLEDNYVKISETKQALKAIAPYSIMLTTDQRLWYEIKSDDLAQSEQVLPIGDNHLHRFNNKINIKFNQSIGLNLYLNESKLNILESNIYPIIIIISVPEKTVAIQQFSPKK
jgi:cytoskeletal protein RodZ|tara:strand:+ start:258 stop:1115 length:858 start_codon:yes stop_codon:yes gene_type:complete